MDVRLPKKCFISHAYADRERRQRLIKSLPSSVEPIIFPPITVAPKDLVSSELIESILGCEGLIYLRGDASDRSFWVAFERDYAIRAGKRVFSFESDGITIREDLGPPLDLAAFASYHQRDGVHVQEVVEFLNQKRHFEIWLAVNDLHPGAPWAEEIEHALADRLSRGGYAVVFWSHAASRSEFVKAEIRRAAEGMPNFNDRVLFALLEDIAPPEVWLRFHEPAVQLFGDTERPETQRMDDLMVRLYWLIYKKTNQSEL